MGAAASGETTCSVLGGEFALLMQAGLGGITVSVLVTKKYLEHGDRSWFEFGLDSSKQIFGAGWIHVANMLCAILFAERLAGVDGCTWYAANIIVDTTLGVGVEWALLQGVKSIVIACRFQALQELLETGSYWRLADGERQFRVANYASQLVVWLLIVTLMKVSMVALMQVLPQVVYAINAALSVFASMPRVKLFAVMIVIPMMMNSLQFVLTDNFIKRKVPSDHIGYALPTEALCERHADDGWPSEDCDRRPLRWCCHPRVASAPQGGLLPEQAVGQSPYMNMT